MEYGMEILNKSNKYKVLKKLKSRLEKANEIEKKLLESLFRYLMTTLGLITLAMIIILTISNSIFFPLISLIVTFFIALFSFPSRKKIDKVMTIKKETIDKIDKYLKFDYALNDNVEFYFEELMQLKEAGRLDELDRDIITDLIEEKKKLDNLPESTNENIVNGFVDFELNNELSSEIVND